MSKKKKWWQKGSWAGSEQKTSGLFSNSIKQHERKFDKDGIEYLNDDDYYGSSYDYGFDKKLMNKDQKFEEGQKGKEQKYALIKSEYADSYNNYNKTGYWGGYSSYRTPQLSYKYVQQMANALAAQHQIKVQVGNDWQVDLLKKTLTYNPASLIYGTKSELLATLMHEIGKLRYCTHSSQLNNKYITMYELPALEVLSIYEDVRTDFLMLKAYESASEIYQSVIPTIEEQVKLYVKKGTAVREIVIDIIEQTFKSIQQNHTDSNGRLTNLPQLHDTLLKTFGESDFVKVKQAVAEMKKNLNNTGNIYEYCGAMLEKMYDLDEQGHREFDNIKEKVEATLDTIEPAKKTGNSQELVDYLDGTTYPIIEDLLKDAKKQNEAIKNAFPNMPKEIMEHIMRIIQDNLNQKQGGQGVNVNANGNVKSRSSGQTNETIPPEWENGDYKTLKDSVSAEIRQLINRLTFIRRDELTVRYQGEQKRGKLNTKKLYKSSTGSRRLFKKKLENTDTIQSFAFSVLLDTSGSMDGPRIVHSTRALIILGEVFKKMNIPFELIAFSDGARHIKTFEKEIDKTMEKQIGGLPRNNGGGTNLNRGLDLSKIHDRAEKNKIVIILTDGGVGDARWFDDKYFIPWGKKNIKSMGIGIECEREVELLCQGRSKLLNNASALPVEFTRILKTLIKR